MATAESRRMCSELHELNSNLKRIIKLKEYEAGIITEAEYKISSRYFKKEEASKEESK